MINDFDVDEYDAFFFSIDLKELKIDNIYNSKKNKINLFIKELEQVY
jgi:hypothetical protein